jgi:hypothetical protein
VAPSHEASDGPCGVAKTRRECGRGIPGEEVRGDRFSTGHLHHDIDKAKVEGPQVVIGRVRPHVDRKLAL